MGGVWPDLCGLADCLGLYLDHGHYQGRVVSDVDSGARCGRALSTDGVDLWWHGRFGGAGFQTSGPGELVLLVRNRLHFYFSTRVCEYERHTCAFPHGAAQLTLQHRAKGPANEAGAHHCKHPPETHPECTVGDGCPAGTGSEPAEQKQTEQRADGNDDDREAGLLRARPSSAQRVLLRTVAVHNLRCE